MDQYFDEEKAQAPEEEPQTSKADDTKSGDDKTYVLPKSIAGEKSVGDTLTLKIVAEHEDSLEVQPVSESESETESEEPEPSTPAPAARGSMDEMMD